MWQPFVKAKPSHVFGLKFTDIELKLCGVRKEPDVIASVKLPSDIVKQGQLLDIDACSAAISKLLIQQKLKPQQIKFLLLNDATQFSTFNIDRDLSQAEQDAQVELVFAEHIDTDVAELAFDYKLLAATEDEQEVLVASQSNSNIQAFRALAKQLKLSLIAIKVQHETGVEFNLLPYKELNQLKLKREFALAAIAIFISAIILIFLVNQYAKSQLSDLKQINHSLRQEIHQLDLRLNKINKLRVDKASLLQKITIIQGLQANRKVVVRLLDILPKLLPKGVYLTTVNFKTGRVVFVGKSDANKHVSEFMRRIALLPWVHDPVLKEIKNPKQKTIQRFSEFVLEAKVLYPKQIDFNTRFKEAYNAVKAK